MKAYKNTIKLTEGPDVADIRSEGRRSAIGRLRRGESFNYWSHRWHDVAKIIHNDRGYCRPAHKAAIRRYFKRVARAMNARFEAAAES